MKPEVQKQAHSGTETNRKKHEKNNVIFAPVSPGQLFDQISILEIKSEKIADEQKLKNVHTELEMLRKLAHGHGLTLERQEYKKLKEINEVLWDIEDHIREKERAGLFDSEFISLARSVYYTNDQRSRVKRQINLSLGSEIVEEKSYTKY